jgi:hypothetical protein
MTDGPGQALANAVLGLLRADTTWNSTCPTYDGLVPSGAKPPYRQVYFNITRPSEDLDNAADGRSRVWILYTYVHNVGGGTDASAARAVAQRSETHLVDKSPTVPGLSVGLIRLEDSQSPGRDETTGVFIGDAVQTYRLRATS